MKNSTIAWLALLACGGPAAGQDALTIYGVADAGLVRESGGVAGTQNKISSGVASASRLGFTGSENLGRGLSAVFTLEAGFRIDTGAIDSSGTLFNRQAFVGLKGAAGTLTLGRQFTPYHRILSNVADPFENSLAGSAKNLFPDSGANVRNSNTVAFAAPAYRGFSGELAYSLGEQSNSSAGSTAGASLKYAGGALTVALAYNRKNSDVAAAPGIAPVERSSGTNRLLAMNYRFGAVKAYFAYGADKGFNSAPLANRGNPYGGVAPTPSQDGNEMLLGVSVPLRGGALLASVMRKDDQTAFNQDARSWGVGYVYPLSKRTSLYGAYASISNRNGAGYTVANNSEAGSGDSAFNLGLRTRF